MSKILIVVDSPDNLKILTMLLKYKGYVTIQAENGLDALVKVRKESPDLIITDVLMPIMDGYELVRQLYLDPQLAHIPVLFYSGIYDKDEVSILVHAGAILLALQKPSEINEILKAVEDLLASGYEKRTLPHDYRDKHLQILTAKLSKQAEELEIEREARISAEERLEEANRHLTELFSRLQSQVTEKLGISREF